MKTRIFLLLLLAPLVLPGESCGRYVDGFNRYITVISGTGPDPGIKAVAVQPWDGKVIIGGNFSVNRGDIVQSNLARLKTDGTLDTGFTASAGGTVQAIAIQPDRSILIGGKFGAVTAETVAGTPGVRTEATRHGLARLSSDNGRLDDFVADTPDTAVVNAIVFDAGSGSILIGGNFQVAPSVTVPAGCRNIARLSAVTGGFSQCFAGGLAGGEVSAVLLEEGKVVAGGAFPGYLARFTADGVRDGDFAPALTGAVRSLALQVDGKILAGGGFPGHLVRLASTGGLDTGFNPAPTGEVAAIALQPDGRIVIGGSFDERLARLELDGTPDPELSPELDGAVSAVALQPDGKILAAGSFTVLDGKNWPLLARFYRYGILDDDVVGPELDFWNPWDNFGWTYGMSAQPDGSIIVGGNFQYLNGEQVGNIFKLNPDWSVASWDDFPVGIPNMWAWVWQIAPTTDGRLTLAGRFYEVTAGSETYNQHSLTQLMPDYSLDPVFSANADAMLGEAWQEFYAVVHSGSGWSYLAGDIDYEDHTPGTEMVWKFDSNGKEEPNFVKNALPTVETLTGLNLLPPWGGDQEELIVNTFYLGSFNHAFFFAKLTKDGTVEDFPAVSAEGSDAMLIRDDGKFLVSRYRLPTLTDGDKSWDRNLVLVDENGNIDDTFRLEFSCDLYKAVDPVDYGWVSELQELADGSVAIGGTFNRVKDVDGAWIPCANAAIVDREGHAFCPTDDIYTPL